MKDFIYYAPTQVVFGALSEDKTGKLVKQYSGTKVLVHYGGQSAERSGGSTTTGNLKVLHRDDMENIYHMANR